MRCGLIPPRPRWLRHSRHLKWGRPDGSGQPPRWRSSRRDGVNVSGTRRSAPQRPQRINAAGFFHGSDEPCVRHRTKRTAWRSRIGRRSDDFSEVQDPSMKTAKLATPRAQEIPTTAIQSKPCGQGPALCQRRLRRYRRRRSTASSPDGGGVTRTRAGTHSPPGRTGHGPTQAG
jgi:hypothetical protein